MSLKSKIAVKIASVVAAMALFAACGAQPGTSSVPVSSGGESQSQPAVSSGASPSLSPGSLPASLDAPADPAGQPDDGMEEGALPLLAQANTLVLDTAPVSWWFGRDRDERGVPLQCTLVGPQYADLGLLCLGPDEGAVYLTFDLGYETGYTAQILDALLDKNAKAAFFLTYNYLRDQPDLVRRMVEEGHSVGGHSITHPGGPGGLPGLGAQAQTDEMAAVKDKLLEDYGYTSRLFRFPEGIYSPRSLGLAANLGLYSVFWSHAYTDWDASNQPDTAQARQALLDAAHPGAIYLLHPQRANADALPGLIDALRKSGYEIGRLF